MKSNFSSSVEEANDKLDKPHEDEELSLSVFQTYTILFKILCLKPMMIMVGVLLTAKVCTLVYSKWNIRSLQIAFAATDGMTDLKLIAAGITTEKIASRSLFLTPLHVGIRNLKFL
jgi:PAT family acetyl-CoA transporter-like MFS transporter 1